MVVSILDANILRTLMKTMASSKSPKVVPSQRSEGIGGQMPKNCKLRKNTKRTTVTIGLAEEGLKES